MARRNGNKQKRMTTKIYDRLPPDLQKIAEEMGFRSEKRNNPHKSKNRRGRRNYNDRANRGQRNGRGYTK
mgnify:CR=1 FL=1